MFDIAYVKRLFLLATPNPVSFQALDDKKLIESIEAAITATNKNGDICPSQASQ